MLLRVVSAAHGLFQHRLVCLTNQGNAQFNLIPDALIANACWIIASLIACVGNNWYGKVYMTDDLRDASLCGILCLASFQNFVRKGRQKIETHTFMIGLCHWFLVLTKSGYIPNFTLTNLRAKVYVIKNI